MSSGVAVAGALRMPKNMENGVVVTVLPDRGAIFKYYVI